MASAALPTPTPWTRRFGADIYAGASPSEAGRLLFEAKPTNGTREELEEAWANAAFVVRACNAHAGLLAAIKMMKAAFRDNRGLTMDEFKQMQAAISAAERG